MTDEPEGVKARSSASGLLVPAGLFVGMGIGLALDHLVAGLFIGLGAGFLGMALVAFWVSSAATRPPQHGHPTAGTGTG